MRHNHLTSPFCTKSGGLELLFSNVQKHTLKLSSTVDDGKAPTVGYLVTYLCEHLMRDERKDMFVLDGLV
jgi:ubiquitin related modifier 1